MDCAKSALAHQHAPASQVRVPCLSLQEPFASALVLGVKSLESRSTPLLRGYAGTRMGIRVGCKEWGAVSGGAKRQATRPPPLPAMARVPRLPGKGKVVGVVAWGVTMTKAEAAEQVGKAEVARRVGLPYEHVGAFVTEVEYAYALAAPVEGSACVGTWQGVADV